jgi:hypothetical protein
MDFTGLIRERHMMIEEWKNIPEWEGIYMVSNLGEVRSLDGMTIKRNGVSFTRKGRILKSTPNGEGYHTVKLCRVGIQRSYKVHRMVAMCFISNFSEDLQVDHINGDRNNNRRSNLRMLSHQENSQAHRKSHKGSTSKYRGVYSLGNKWGAAIKHNGKQVHIGRFSSEIEAAIEYNKKAVEYGYFKEALNKL